jgi:hypothetical protein
VAITNMDTLYAAMASGAYGLPLTRASIANQVAGSETSLWRGTGFPTQGAIPGAAAICSSSLTGALPLAARTGTQDRVIASVEMGVAAAGHAIIIEDRLAHMGGLAGNVATPTTQTVGIDLHTNLSTSNLAQRIGNANYSQVEWYLEWYSDTGATSVTPTAQVTYNDASTGSVNVWVLGGTAIPATTRASRRYKLNPTNGKYIRSVETITLSATTGGVGSFGVTAVRRLALVMAPVALRRDVWDWSVLGAPQIYDDACVTLSQVCITTSTGATAGAIMQAVG